MHEYHKEAVFDHFVADAMGQLPTDVTFNRLKAVKPVLLRSREYKDELQRHNIGNVSVYRLRDTSNAVYLHLKGNFWTMVLDVLYKLREEGLR